MNLMKWYSSWLKGADNIHVFLYTVFLVHIHFLVSQVSFWQQAKFLCSFLSRLITRSPVIEMQSRTSSIITYSLICFQMKFRIGMVYVLWVCCYDFKGVKLVIKFLLILCCTICLVHPLITLCYFFLAHCKSLL